MIKLINVNSSDKALVRAYYFHKMLPSKLHFNAMQNLFVRKNNYIEEDSKNDPIAFKHLHPFNMTKYYFSATFVRKLKMRKFSK